MTAATAELGNDEGVLRVLLCDDDPVMSDALSDLVRHAEGFELVGVANDADSAAALAETSTPDVVLLDVRMPGGGGPQAARLIRRHLEGVRLIAFSAHSDRKTVLAMLRAGVSEYLVKGVDRDVDILDALRGVGDGRLGLSPLETNELVSDLVELLVVAEARLAAPNEDLLRLVDGAKSAAADAMASVESALDRLPPAPDVDTGEARDALELALSSHRHVVDSLSAVTALATTHAGAQEAQ